MLSIKITVKYADVEISRNLYNSLLKNALSMSTLLNELNILGIKDVSISALNCGCKVTSHLIFGPHFRNLC